MAILSKPQFAQIRPQGSYDAYLKFVANRRQITVAELRTTAQVGLPKAQMEAVTAAAYASGNLTPGSRGAESGGGRLSQSPELIRERGYIKFGGKKYVKGDGDRLYMDLVDKGQSYDAWAKRWPTLAKFVGKPQVTGMLTRQITKALRARGAGPKLIQLVAPLVVESLKAGWDPRFFVGLAGHEQTWGWTSPANSPYNLWGWGVYTGTQGAQSFSAGWDTPEKAAKAFVKQFTEGYGGARGIQSMGAYAESSGWEAGVAAAVAAMGGDAYNIRWTGF